VVAAGTFASSAAAFEYVGCCPELDAAEGFSTAGYNERTYNWIGFDNPYGGAPQMGANYRRTDGTAPGWVWSNTGDLYDDRNIAYAKAECMANWGNNYRVVVYWCETSGQG
jgi:hypothetical protein